MTMMTIGIAILAVLAVMILAGLILWQRQTSTQLRIVQNMEQQLQILRQELEKLNQKVEEASDSYQRIEPRQELENNMVERQLEESVFINGEKPSEDMERTSETKTQEEGPSEKELERLDAEITRTLEAAAEQFLSEQSQGMEGNSEDAEREELDSDIWSQLVELAEQQEEQEQKEQGQSADDEKLIDSDQEGEKPGPSGYNVGKSGKIYTEEELELLIKE
ncbi:MAG: hypothetical protein HFE75_14275 [Firmicutes bacterium]|jgi:hypothetical protein|nr:hypothetical protein [Bacillota bacterium]